MKKSIYFLMTIAAALFASCEPMDDIYNEVDSALEAQPNVGTVEYVLVEEDYTEEVAKGGLGMENSFFTSLDQANDSLPKFLDNKYPIFGKGSIANLTVEVAEPLNADPVAYTVTAEDYTAMELEHANFDKDFQITNLLSSKYADAEENTLVELTYDWYQYPETVTRTNTYVFANGMWSNVLVLDGDDYDTMQEAYDNFDTRDEAVQKIPVFLNQTKPYAKKGDVQAVLFEVHEDGGNAFLKTFTFDGTTWRGSFDTVLQFGHNGEEWEPDNTIVYTFAPEDYVTVGEALLEKYPDAAGNVKQYASFEIRSGYTNEWTEAMLVEAAAIILDQVDPEAADGQKYLVNLTTYSGTYATKGVSVIKQDGVWVAF